MHKQHHTNTSNIDKDTSYCARDVFENKALRNVSLDYSGTGWSLGDIYYGKQHYARSSMNGTNSASSLGRFRCLVRPIGGRNTAHALLVGNPSVGRIPRGELFPKLGAR